MFRSSSRDSAPALRLQQLVSLLSHDVLGDAVSPAELDFATIECRAHEAGQRIARALCEQFPAAQARTAHEPRPCPDCGRPCTGTVEPRELITRDGPIQLDEARHHCPSCRRDFFPQPTEATVEPSAVQPGDADDPGLHGHGMRLVRGRRQTARDHRRADNLATPSANALSGGRRRTRR
jgi:hypothetical protein